MSVMVIDNYDSFTYNLVHGLAKAGADPVVHRNDAITYQAIEAAAPERIVLSPGPGHPAVARDFGVCADLIKRPLGIPMLGVCLGMQGMAHHTGAQVTRAPEVVHGEARGFERGEHAIFNGLPGRLEVGRYHSLCVDAASLSSDWNPLGTTDDGVLMAMAHRDLPWVGLQFHPESILSPHGQRMLANFMEM